MKILRNQCLISLLVCLLISVNCSIVDKDSNSKPNLLNRKGIEEESQQLRISSRRIQMKMSNMVGMMLVPPLIVAGLVPFIIPGFSMAVFINSLLNNMAFTSALVSFLRANIFENDPHDNIIYVNHGYPSTTHTNRFAYHKS